MCKYCSVPIYIKVNSEYLELPNNFCPMCGEKVEVGLKEVNKNAKRLDR